MNKHTLSNLISLGEGFTTEFKRTGTSNLGRKICAFANATGGIILIGVSDDGEIVGVGKHNKLKSQVQSIARSAEPQPESQPESLEMRVLILLSNGPMAKSALSIGLGQKEISGQLNKVIRQLLANKIIKFTIPEKPKSRLQKYQLTAKGKELPEKWRTSQ